MAALVVGALFPAFRRVGFASALARFVENLLRAVFGQYDDAILVSKDDVSRIDDDAPADDWNIHPSRTIAADIAGGESAAIDWQVFFVDQQFASQGDAIENNPCGASALDRPGHGRAPASDVSRCASVDNDNVAGFDDFRRGEAGEGIFGIGAAQRERRSGNSPTAAHGAAKRRVLQEFFDA